MTLVTFMALPAKTPDSQPEPNKREELTAFVFICVFLFPLLSVSLIGTYGLLIWLSQIIGGH